MVFFLVQLIDNNILVPKVVASHVKINAFAAILFFFIGGAVWGPAGMVLSLPLLGIIKVVLDRVESLEPFGFLLGDTMPDSPDILLFRKRKKEEK